MIQVIREVNEIGNGGHIYLPKEFVGQKVRVDLLEKSIDDIKSEIIELLKPQLAQIEGVYLYGSYARDEQTTDSDIDILVITDLKIPNRINKYEIVAISLEKLEKSIGITAPLVLPILKESKALFNEKLIQKYKEAKLTKKNTKWYIETTESSLKLAENWLEDKKIEKVEYIVYPLLIRLKGLIIIDLLVKSQNYSNKKLIDFLVKKGFLAYKSKELILVYREHRDNRNITKNSISKADLLKLYRIVNGYFKEIKEIWEKLK